MKFKIYCLLLSICSVYNTPFSQPRVGLQRTIGGLSSDYFSCMDITTDGGIILGGYSYSKQSGDKTENSRGQSDYWIVKLDRRGRTQWDKTIGGNREDWLNSIEQTADGGYILGGVSYSIISGEKTENPRGGEDYWIVKLDNAGNILWDKTYGGTNHDRFKVIRQTTDGGYIAGGYSKSGISGEKSENSRGIEDFWVVKLDSNGTLQWDKTIGGQRQDELSDLVQTADGGYILGGFSESGISGDKTENTRGSSDYWIVKLDNTGNIRWNKTIGGAGSDQLSAISQTADGGYIMSGSSISNISGEKMQNQIGSYDFWVVKTDSLANLLWSQTIGGIDYDLCRSFEKTIDGGYILGGYSYSNQSGNKTENSKGAGDYWVVKLNGLGQIEWDKTIGGFLTDDLRSIKEISANNYVLGGSSFSDSGYDKTDNSKGEYDFWLMKLRYVKPDSARPVSDFLNNMQAATGKNITGFSVYPNPAIEMMHIQTDRKANFSLSNQDGKILFRKTINGNGVINVSHLPSGIYYLKNDKTREIKKILISK